MADSEFGYEKLEVWKLGMELVTEIYDVTKSFPLEERFGLTAQLRRAAVSVPANLAEGYGRTSKASFANYARISQRSLYELRTELELAVRTGTGPRDRLFALKQTAARLSRMLDGFIRSLEKAE